MPRSAWEVDLASQIACQVVPDIPSFAVDDGFTYRVPDGTAVNVGSRVRIRVSGRRLRGFVTALVPVPDRRIIDLDGVVGDIPSFDEALLATARWCAAHYIAPLSTILGRTVPANVPRSDGAGPRTVTVAGPGFRSEFIQSSPPHARTIDAILAEVPRAALVVVPAVAEVDEIADDLRGRLGDRVVVAHSQLSGREETDAWVAAATRGDAVVVGTREVALWPVRSLERIIVVEELRRVHKSPSTPTLDTATVARQRAVDAAIPVAFVGPLPSVGTSVDVERVDRPPGRLWPIVEVVDRTEDAPTNAALVDRTRAAILGVAKTGGQVFVLTPRRGYAKATRCGRCGTLRRCPVCDAASSTGDECDRCGTVLDPCAHCGARRWQALGAGTGRVIAELERSTDAVGPAGTGSLIEVGTERDLVGRKNMSLAVAVGVDGMAGAPNYRAQEAALFVLARLALTVKKGSGNRCLLQTSDPAQPVIEALRSGSYERFIESEIQKRRSLGFPPFGELIAMEIGASAEAPELLDDALTGKARILGPADMGDRQRWLIQAPDLSEARVALRGVVGRLRDADVRVRVDADPIDL